MWERAECSLQSAGVLALAVSLFWLPSPVVGQSAHSTPTPVLTTAQQVRALSPDQVKLGRSVRLRGKVLVLSGWKNSFFFSDGSGGIFIDRNDVLPAVHSGDEVEVVGKSATGLFAPIVVSDHVRMLGKTKLPPPPRLGYLDLVGGTRDSQWVEVRGVVHAAWIAPSWGRSVLFLDIVFCI